MGCQSHFKQRQNTLLSSWPCEQELRGTKSPWQPHPDSDKAAAPTAALCNSSRSFRKPSWFSYHLPLTPAHMQDAAWYVPLMGKAASPPLNSEERHFSRYQTKDTLPLHMQPGHKCWSLWQASTKTQKPSNKHRSQGAHSEGNGLWCLLCREITLPCRRPTGAVADNLTGSLQVPWGLVWLQELWGKQGHTAWWHIQISWCWSKMQEVDTVHSKLLIFWRYLGHDSESQRVRDRCYLIPAQTP